MKVQWQIKLKLNNSYSIDYNSRPFLSGKELIFAYPCIDKAVIRSNKKYSTKIFLCKIDVLSGDMKREVIQFKNDETRKGKILNTREWYFIEQNNTIKLNSGIEIDVNTKEIELKNTKRKSKKGEIKPEYNFDDIVVKYNQRSTIECLSNKTKESLWKIKIVGYLYTHIEKKGNYFYFGSSGKGGAFYCINSINGEMKMEFKNRDSSNYEWNNEKVYLQDLKGQLIQLNPLNGDFKTLKLNGKCSVIQ